MTDDADIENALLALRGHAPIDRIPAQPATQDEWGRRATTSIDGRTISLTAAEEYIAEQVYRDFSPAQARLLYAMTKEKGFEDKRAYILREKQEAELRADLEMQRNRAEFEAERQRYIQRQRDEEEQRRRAIIEENSRRQRVAYDDWQRRRGKGVW